MAWQRGLAAQECYAAGKLILGHKTIKPDALQAFQQLYPAVLPSGHRPIPCFGGDKKIEEKWCISTVVTKDRKSVLNMWLGLFRVYMIRISQFLPGEQ